MSIMNVVKLDKLPDQLTPNTVYLIRVDTVENPNKLLTVVTDSNGTPYESISSNDLLSNIKTDTIESLRDIPYVSGMSNATTRGSSSAGDGGGGDWYWDAISTATDNTGTIVKPASIAVGDPGRWVRNYSGPLNIRWFNTGTVDDTVAFQTAVDTIDNEAIYFPAGTYTLESDINIVGKKIRIIGDGIRKTVISRIGNAVLFKITGGASNLLTSDIEISNLQLINIGIRFRDYISFARIYDVSFVRTTDADYNYTGILADAEHWNDQYTYLNNLDVQNCRFFGMKGGIRTDNPNVHYDSVTIFNNYCRNNPWVGIVIGYLDSKVTQTKCTITKNVVLNIGDYSGITAPQNYVVGIRGIGDEVIITDNIVTNVVCADYWESDGIYVKQKMAIVANNILTNAGYRSAITTKQLGDNGAITARSVLIDNNQVYFDASNTGYSGNPGNAFQDVVNLYGGINIVSHNTTVSNNTINGAGYGIYAINSTTPWYLNNIRIDNNNIIKNRGRYGIYLIGAGDGWTVTNNKLRDFNPVFTTYVTGICIEFLYPSRYATSPTYWVSQETLYINKKIINAHIANNYVDLSVNTSVSAYGIVLDAENSIAGGSMPTYPSSFENTTVVNNIVHASNAGAGAAFSYIVQTEPERFINCYFNTQQSNNKSGNTFPAGYGISGYRRYAGNPNGFLTPGFIGDMVLDTTNNIWYKSSSTTSGSWKAINALPSSISVGTVALQRASTHHVSYASMITLGCSAAGDGGGGDWYWDPLSTATDNTGTVVKPASIAVGNPGRWVRLYSGPINLKWFTQPSETNIATGFKNAVAVAIANSDPLYVPRGNWTYTDSATLYLQLCNSDGTCKTLEIIGDGVDKSIISVNVPGIAFDISNQNNVPLLLKKITFKNPATTSSGRTCFRVWARSAKAGYEGKGQHGGRFWVEETKISGFTYTGIWAIANLNSGGSRSLFLGPAGYVNSVPPTHPATTGIATPVETFSMDSAGIRIWGGSGPPDTGPNRSDDKAQDLFMSNLMFFTQCMFMMNRTGLDILGSKVTLDTCVVERNWIGVSVVGGLEADLTGEDVYPGTLSCKGVWFEYNYKYHWTQYPVDYATGADIVSSALYGQLTFYDQLEQIIVSYDSSQVREDNSLSAFRSNNLIVNKGLRIVPKTYNSGMSGAPFQLGGSAGMNAWLDGNNDPKWSLGPPATADAGVFFSKKGQSVAKLMIGTTESATGVFKYAIIGNVVHFTVAFSVTGWTKGSATGAVKITGLPIACLDSYGIAHITTSNIITTTDAPPIGRISGGSTEIILRLSGASFARGLYDVTDTHLAAEPVDLFFYMTGHYLI